MGKVIELNRTESIFNSKLSILDWGTFRRIFFSDINLEEWNSVAFDLEKKIPNKGLKEYFIILFDDEIFTRKVDDDSDSEEEDNDQSNTRLFKALRSSLKIIVSYMRDNYHVSKDVIFSIIQEDGLICIKTKRNNFSGSSGSSSSTSIVEMKK